MGRVQLCSIAPVEIRVSRTYNVGVHFDPCVNGRKCSISETKDRIEHKVVYLDAHNFDKIPIPVTGEEVATDLLKNEQLDREGVFIMPAPPVHSGERLIGEHFHEVTGKCVLSFQRDNGTTYQRETPTDAEIENARQVRKEWLARHVQSGDEEYSRTKRIDQIPDFCKRAARELGIKRDWVFTPPENKATLECEGCGTVIQLLKDGSKPAVCASCHAILDREKAERLGIVSSKPVPEAPQPVKTGKPS